MLLGKNFHGTVEDENIVDAGLLGALALVVDDACLGEIVVLVAALRDAIRQVNVLAIHEKGLVKQTNFVERLFTHQHESTSQNLHFVGFVVREMPHVITCKTFTMWEELGQAKHLVERCLRRGQSTFRLRQKLSLAVHHLHAETASIGVAVHEGDAFRESIVFHNRVGIEEQYILACRDADGLVVGFRETDILLVGDDLHLRELLRQHLQRAIDRVVVDDKHLPFDALHGATHRIEALFEEILDVIVDDDDREFHFLYFSGLLSKLAFTALIFRPSYSLRVSLMFSKPQAFRILPLMAVFCIQPVNCSAPGP